MNPTTRVASHFYNVLGHPNFYNSAAEIHSSPGREVLHASCSQLAATCVLLYLPDLGRISSCYLGTINSASTPRLKTPNMDPGSDSDDSIAAILMFSLPAAAVAGALLAQRRIAHSKFGGIFGGSRIGKARNRDRHCNRFESQTN